MSIFPRFTDGARAVAALTRAGGDVARTFRADATEAQALAAAVREAAVAQHGAEFAPVTNGFDAVVNGINRLPRPMLAFGTLGLFVYAMVDPMGFAPRMEGLALVPEPLWWLLGAIVGFYFGARELHHRRVRVTAAPRPAPRHSAWHASHLSTDRVPEDGNGALAEWRAARD